MTEDRSSVNDDGASGGVDQEGPEQAGPGRAGPAQESPEQGAEPLRPDTGVHEELAEIPPAPPRPKQRRFQGTVQQISGSLNFYRAFAFITGVMLLILVAKMIMDYGFGYELYAGGVTAEGAENSLGFHPKDSVSGGEGISYWVAVVHGWIYVIYVIASFRLWFLMSWTLGRLISMVLGGVVPFLSFIVERRIAAEVHREVEENPEAVRRY